MAIPDDFMAVATTGGDVIRRRVRSEVVTWADMSTYRTPVLRPGEFLLERIGKAPMIVQASSEGIGGA